MSDDRLDVIETVYRYATGVDRRDWPALRRIFTDEIEVDFSSYDGRPAARVAADAWVASLRPLFHGLAASQHSMTNPIVRLDGDRARCTMYVQAEHVLDADGASAFHTIGGFYEDDLVRTRAGWRISGVALTVTWRRGDAGIMAIAHRRGRAVLSSDPTSPPDPDP